MNMFTFQAHVWQVDEKNTSLLLIYFLFNFYFFSQTFFVTFDFQTNTMCQVTFLTVGSVFVKLYSIFS